MSAKKLLVGLKEGVLPAEVLPQTVRGFGEGISFERLHSIDNEVNEFKSRNFRGTPNSVEDHDEIFNNEIYAEKPEAEKKMYRTYKLDIPDSVNTEALKAQLASDNRVEFVQEDELNELYFHPNDPSLGSLYGLQKLQCEQAWDITKGETIIVAVIDTGVDYNHPDLAANMWKNAAGKMGYDFSDNDSDPKDYHGHGTHTAGTVGAVGNNGIGVIGVAPNVKIMAVKIFPNALDSVCAQALKYAVDNGAKILSNSWGPTGRRPSNPAVEQAIDYVYSKGGIVIFAAGNSNDDVAFYSPSNYAKVISVGATDQNDARAGFSNFGPKVTVAAPGVGILSTQMNTTGYVGMSGTSMACPHVAGLAALVLAKKPDTSFEEMRDIIKNNVDAITPDKPIGTGRVNAFKSVKSAIAIKTGPNTYYYNFRGNGVLLLNIPCPDINASSSVLAAISEYNTNSRVNRFQGAAKMAVYNIAPYQGGVFILAEVSWASPLNTSLDLLVN